jgi:hypothetical protein
MITPHLALLGFVARRSGTSRGCALHREPSSTFSQAFMKMNNYAPEYEMKSMASVQEKHVPLSVKHVTASTQPGLRVRVTSNLHISKSVLTLWTENLQLHADVFLCTQLHVILGSTGNVRAMLFCIARF